MTKGHNNPPDPIDAALSPFSDTIAEAEGWLDGEEITTEGQMQAVDELIKGVKEARKAVAAAEESAAKPLYDIWKAEKAKFAPTLADLERIVKGLVAAVDPFKRKLAAEKAEAERKARQEAERKMREAEGAARAANAADINAQREADAARQAAEDAIAAAKAASKDTVKGLRQTTTYEITDGVACARWVWLHDREALMGFLEAYVARAKNPAIDGVTEHKERKAF